MDIQTSISSLECAYIQLLPFVMLKHSKPFSTCLHNRYLNLLFVDGGWRTTFFCGIRTNILSLVQLCLVLWAAHTAGLVKSRDCFCPTFQHSPHTTCISGRGISSDVNLDFGTVFIFGVGVSDLASCCPLNLWFSWPCDGVLFVCADLLCRWCASVFPFCFFLTTCFGLTWPPSSCSNASVTADNGASRFVWMKFSMLNWFNLSWIHSMHSSSLWANTHASSYWQGPPGP